MNRRGLSRWDEFTGAKKKNKRQKVKSLERVIGDPGEPGGGSRR